MAENPFAKYAPQAALQPAPSDTSPTGGNPFAKYAPAQSAPTPAPEKPQMNAIAAGQQGILKGMTAGYGDEIMAGMMTPVEMGIRALSGEDAGKGFGDRISNAYDISLANQRAQLQAAQEQHPIATGVGSVAGGLALGGTMAKGGVTLMNGAATLPKMMALGATEGGIYGAVGGFGEGQGSFDDRLNSAKSGAIWGATVGGAMPALARGVGAGLSYVRDNMSASPAQRLILDDIAAEGTTPQELAAKAKSLGPDGMLADTSETLRLRAEQLAQSDNPARPGIMDALKTRAAGAGDRINTIYDAAAGQRPDVKQTLDNIITQRSAAAQPLYEKALGRPVVWDNRLQQFIDDPIVKQGLAQGMKIQRLESLAEGTPFNPHDYAITDFDAAGDPIVTQVPNMRTLNVVKKGLDAMVEASKNEFGKLSEEGRAIDGVRRAFLNKLDAANPDYAAARQAWQGPTLTLQAFQKGQDILSSKVHPDFLAADIAKMSDAEKDALKLGLRAAVDRATGQVRNGALKGRTLLDSDWNERKILNVLGEQDGRPLINGLLGEQEMAATTNQALGNSATARRQDNPFKPQNKVGEDAKSVMSPLKNMLNFRFGDAAGDIWQQASDAFAARRAGSLARDTGPMLTAQGPELDRVTQALIEAQNRRAAVDASNPQIEQATRELLMNGARNFRPLSSLGAIPFR